MGWRTWRPALAGRADSAMACAIWIDQRGALCARWRYPSGKAVAQILARRGRAARTVSRYGLHDRTTRFERSPPPNPH